MKSDYIVQCPIKGSYHNILTKKGQKILKTYKHMKYNNLSGGDTQSIKIRKQFLELNIQKALLYFFKNITKPILINIYLIIYSDSSGSLLDATFNLLKTKKIEDIGNTSSLMPLKTAFNTHIKQIITTLDVNETIKYVLVRLLTFSHFMLSIIHEFNTTSDIQSNPIYEHYVSTYETEKYRFLSEIIVSTKFHVDNSTSEKNLLKLYPKIKRKQLESLKTLREIVKDDTYAITIPEYNSIVKEIPTIRTNIEGIIVGDEIYEFFFNPYESKKGGAYVELINGETGDCDPSKSFVKDNDYIYISYTYTIKPPDSATDPQPMATFTRTKLPFFLDRRLPRLLSKWGYLSKSEQHLDNGKTIKDILKTPLTFRTDLRWNKDHPLWPSSESLPPLDNTTSTNRMLEGGGGKNNYWCRKISRRVENESSSEDIIDFPDSSPVVPLSDSGVKIPQLEKKFAPNDADFDAAFPDDVFKIPPLAPTIPPLPPQTIPLTSPEAIPLTSPEATDPVLTAVAVTIADSDAQTNQSTDDGPPQPSPQSPFAETIKEPYIENLIKQLQNGDTITRENLEDFQNSEACVINKVELEMRRGWEGGEHGAVFEVNSVVGESLKSCDGQRTEIEKNVKKYFKEIFVVGNGRCGYYSILVSMLKLKYGISDGQIWSKTVIGTGEKESPIKFEAEDLKKLYDYLKEEEEKNPANIKYDNELGQLLRNITLDKYEYMGASFLGMLSKLTDKYIILFIPGAQNLQPLFQIYSPESSMDFSIHKDNCVFFLYKNMNDDSTVSPNHFNYLHLHTAPSTTSFKWNTYIDGIDLDLLEEELDLLEEEFETFELEFETLGEEERAEKQQRLRELEEQSTQKIIDIFNANLPPTHSPLTIEENKKIKKKIKRKIRKKFEERASTKRQQIIEKINSKPYTPPDVTPQLINGTFFKDLYNALKQAEVTEESRDTFKIIIEKVKRQLKSKFSSRSAHNSYNELTDKSVAETLTTTVNTDSTLSEEHKSLFIKNLRTILRQRSAGSIQRSIKTSSQHVRYVIYTHFTYYADSKVTLLAKATNDQLDNSDINDENHQQLLKDIQTLLRFFSWRIFFFDSKKEKIRKYIRKNITREDIGKIKTNLDLNVKLIGHFLSSKGSRLTIARPLPPPSSPSSVVAATASATASAPLSAAVAHTSGTVPHELTQTHINTMSNARLANLKNEIDGGADVSKTFLSYHYMIHTHTKKCIKLIEDIMKSKKLSTHTNKIVATLRLRMYVYTLLSYQYITSRLPEVLVEESNLYISNLYKHINLEDLLTNMTFNTFIQHYVNAYENHSMGGGSAVTLIISLSSGVTDIEGFKQKINQNVLFQNHSYVSDNTLDDHINK